MAEQERARGSGGTNNRWVVSQVSDIARFFRVSLTTITNWRNATPPMPGVDGRWDLSEIAEWRRLQDRSGNVKSQERIDLETRELAAEVSMKETKDKKLKGLLVDRAAAKAAVANILNEARVQLEAVPGIIGSSVPPDIRQEVIHELSQQISLILKKMATKAE